MKQASLNQFIKELSDIWGPLDSDLTKKSKQLLELLATNCLEEDWVKELIQKQLPAKELYRSEAHGFVLMGHIEQKGDSSPPHDHGSGWVIYSTIIGQSEMGIFGRVFHQNGTMSLVQKDSYILEEGQCTVYLPGDIHSTHALQDNTLTLRLTSCDFSQEFKQGRLIRYPNTTRKW